MNTPFFEILLLKNKYYPDMENNWYYAFIS